MSTLAKAIRIGTMIQATDGKAPQSMAAIAELGFESFEPFFWQTTNGQDVAELQLHPPGQDLAHVAGTGAEALVQLFAGEPGRLHHGFEELDGTTNLVLDRHGFS